MAPFLFGSFEPKQHKLDYWFVSALLVLMAGFFSLGLSIITPNKNTAQKSNYELKMQKKTEAIAVIAKPKPKINLIDKAKIEREIRQKELEEQKKEQEEQARLAQIAQTQAYTAPDPEPVYESVGLSTDSLNTLYQSAAAAFGLDWRVLAAVHMVETGQATACYSSSYDGATGPMQFMPSTFAAYAVDGDNDGVLNICDVDDAVFSAANLLASNWGATDIRAALYHYNHSDYYVNNVLNLAYSL